MRAAAIPTAMLVLMGSMASVNPELSSNDSRKTCRFDVCISNKTVTSQKKKTLRKRLLGPDLFPISQHGEDCQCPIYTRKLIMRRFYDIIFSPVSLLISHQWTRQKTSNRIEKYIRHLQSHQKKKRGQNKSNKIHTLILQSTIKY